MDRLPATLGQLAAWAISYGHAWAMVEETAHLDDGLAARVEERVLGNGGGDAGGKVPRAGEARRRPGRPRH